MVIRAVNPATGEIVKEYGEMPPEQVKIAIEHSHQAFLNWRKTSFTERARQMREVAHILRDRAEDYARLMATEMGKPIKGGMAEVDKCAWVCDYYADNAERFCTRKQWIRRQAKASLPFNRWAFYLRLCRGTFPSGKSSAALPRRLWRVMPFY